MTTVDEIRALFEAAEFDVTEEVGAEGGQVDRFATQRSAMMSLRIWWVLVDRFPDDLSIALDELELARDVRGADRALAIVVHGTTPAGYQPDLEGGVTNYVTMRYLALWLSGAFRSAIELLGDPESILALPRRIKTAEEEGDDVDSYIARWIGQNTPTSLVLVGVDVLSVFYEVQRNHAQRFLKNPDEVPPILWGARNLSSGVRKWLLERGWAIVVQDRSERRGVTLLRSRLVTGEVFAKILDLTPDAIVLWFHTVVGAVAAEYLRGWLRREPDAVRLLRFSAVREALANAAHEETTEVEDVNWFSRTLVRTFESVSRAADSYSRSIDWGVLEEAAFRVFALREKLELPFNAISESQFAHDVGFVVDSQASSAGEKSPAFACDAVRDWLLARKIARAVREGERDLLTRYNFPQEYVLQFLAVLAPDVAALATADRVEEMRHEIESQVERQVQLTLGHQLNRSVGALTSNLRSVERALGAAQVDDNARVAMERIREELAHLKRLTDRSRMLYESSAWDLATLALSRVVNDVVLPLREQHARVEVMLDVAPELHVRAADEGLREILHCLIENACHSVCGRAAEHPARVVVRAQRLGETVEVRVTDNGLGVSKEHQERIFEPFVTTKKGGAGGLRGTGLGLSIARRFAARMGARVTLESSNGTTTFVVTFVAGEPT